MILPRFELHQPETLDEALALAARYAPRFDYLAGGTDLLQNYKQRLNPQPHVISLMRIPGLTAVSPERIGALATLSDVAAHPDIRRLYPGLVEAASHVATPLVRNMGTIGGNVLVETRCYYFNQGPFWRASKHFCLKAEGQVCLVVPQATTCYAAFSGDTPPVLIALGAAFVLHGPAGERIVPAREFYKGDGIARHVMRKGEILTEIRLPEEARDLRSGYRKLRLRDAFDYPALGVAAALSFDPGGSRLRRLSIVLGAAASTPLSCEEITTRYVGKDLTDQAAEEIGKAIQEAAQPMKNVMSLSPRYRKRMAGVFVRRLLADLARRN